MLSVSRGHTWFPVLCRPSHTQQLISSKPEKFSLKKVPATLLKTFHLIKSGPMRIVVLLNLKLTKNQVT